MLLRARKLRNVYLPVAVVRQNLLGAYLPSQVLNILKLLRFLQLLGLSPVFQPEPDLATPSRAPDLCRAVSHVLGS